MEKLGFMPPPKAACVNHCLHDGSCPGDMTCCPVGCGHACRESCNAKCPSCPPLHECKIIYGYASCVALEIPLIEKIPHEDKVKEIVHWIYCLQFCAANININFYLSSS